MDAQLADGRTRLITRNIRRIGASVVLAMAVIAVAGVTWSAVLGSDRGSNTGSVQLGSASYVFDIRGGATSTLLPGSEAALDLHLTNTNSVDLEVVELTVGVVAVDAPHADDAHPCSADDFTVRPLASSDARHVVPADSERTLTSLGLPAAAWPTIVMIDRGVNQDGCKLATLTLSYSGVGLVAQP